MNSENANLQETFPLHVAAAHGDVGQIVVRVNTGCPVNTLDSAGATALHIAAQYDQDAAARQLLLLGANPVHNCAHFPSVVHIAAHVGAIKVLQVLIEFQTPLNLQDAEGNTPLHRAVMARHLPVIQTLLNAGVAIDIRNGFGRTALDEAQMTRDPKIAALFRELQVRKKVEKARSAFSTLRDSIMSTEAAQKISTAIESGRESFDRVAEKIAPPPESQSEADASIAQVSGVETMSDVEIVKALSAGSWEQLEQLVDASVNLQVRGAHGETALHIAAYNGDTDRVRLLLTHGALPSSRDSDASTALHAAAAQGHVETAQTLVEHGAKVNAVDSDGFSALHYAAHNGHAAMAEFLIANNAKVELTNVKDETPLDLAKRRGYAAVIAVLREHLTAQKEPSVDEIFTRALDFGITREVIAEHGERFAHHLFEYEAEVRHQILPLLAAQGLLDNLTNADGQTTLHLAVDENDLQSVNILLDAGVDVNFRDADGETPLHLACFEGNPDIVRVLLEHGAQINSLNGAGDTALHIAGAERHTELVTLLKDNGADQSIRNIDGMTPREWVDDDLVYLFDE